MKRLVFLAVGMFAMGCGNYVIAGLLPAISTTLGSSVAVVGQGITAFNLTYVISAPGFAVLLARKPVRVVLLTALTLFALGNLLTLLSTSLFFFVVSRAIVGVGVGLYTPIAVAAAAGLVEPSGRGRALSLVWGSNSVGAVIGVPTGLWLASKLGWWGALGPSLVFCVIALVGITVCHPNLRVAAPPSLIDRVRLLADRRILSVVGITLITAASSLGLYTYVAIINSDSANSVAAALSLWSFGGLIGSIAIGPLVDRTDQPQLLMVSILTILIVSLLALPILRSIPVLGLLPFLLWGAMGWATVTPQLHTLFRLQPKQSGTIAALNGSAMGLGSGLGSALGGFAIAHGLDAGNLPYAAVVLLVVALAWQVFLLNPLPDEVAA